MTSHGDVIHQRWGSHMQLDKHGFCQKIMKSSAFRGDCKMSEVHKIEIIMHWPIGCYGIDTLLNSCFPGAM